MRTGLFVFLGLMLVVTSAFADVVGITETRLGRIYFFAEAGMCVFGAKRAQFVPKHGVAIEGCWTNRPGHLHVVFVDGDSGDVPHQDLKSAKPI